MTNPALRQQPLIASSPGAESARLPIARQANRQHPPSSIRPSDHTITTTDLPVLLPSHRQSAGGKVASRPMQSAAAICRTTQASLAPTVARRPLWPLCHRQDGRRGYRICHTRIDCQGQGRRRGPCRRRRKMSPKRARRQGAVAVVLWKREKEYSWVTKFRRLAL